MPAAFRNPIPGLAAMMEAMSATRLRRSAGKCLAWATSSRVNAEGITAPVRFWRACQMKCAATMISVRNSRTRSMAVPGRHPRVRGNRLHWPQLHLETAENTGARNSVPERNGAGTFLSQIQRDSAAIAIRIDGRRDPVLRVGGIAHRHGDCSGPRQFTE